MSNGAKAHDEPIEFCYSVLAVSDSIPPGSADIVDESWGMTGFTRRHREDPDCFRRKLTISPRKRHWHLRQIDPAAMSSSHNNCPISSNPAYTDQDASDKVASPSNMLLQERSRDNEICCQYPHTVLATRT